MSRISSHSHSHSHSHSQPPPPQPPQPPPATRLNLEITIISGKHFKNVNWKTGDLKPYAILWVDPDNKLTTKSDDLGNTKPVWNQRFLLPITSSFSDAFLSLEIFHSKASETPKPFVGSLHIRLSTLPEFDNPNLIRTFDLLRPSGRPQGKIRLKLSIKEQYLPGLDYDITPNPNANSGYYYSSAPPFPYTTSRSPLPLPSPTAYPYSVGHYSGYYPARSYGAPSAPVDYSPYEPRPRNVGGGFGTGITVGALAGAVGGIALNEGLKYEEEKIAERVEENYLGTPKDDFSDYRGEF